MTELTRILHVDDEPDIQAVTALALEVLGGFTVESCGSGAEALERAESFRPDLIILDVMMPVMNGHEACRALKENPDTAQIPVILLTAVASRVTSSKYTHRDMMETEAEDYIPKPVEPEVLHNRIKDWL